MRINTASIIKPYSFYAIIIRSYSFEINFISELIKCFPIFFDRHNHIIVISMNFYISLCDSASKRKRINACCICNMINTVTKIEDISIISCPAFYSIIAAHRIDDVIMIEITQIIVVCISNLKFSNSQSIETSPIIKYYILHTIIFNKPVFDCYLVA